MKTQVRRGVPFGMVRCHWEKRPSSLEYLNLRFFVHTKDNRVFWRTHVQPDNVPDFVDKKKGGAECENLGPVRLDMKCAPDLVHDRLTDTHMLRVLQWVASGGLVSSIRRIRSRTFLSEMRSVSLGLALIVQTVDAELNQMTSPLDHRVGTKTAFRSSVRVWPVLSTKIDRVRDTIFRGEDGRLTIASRADRSSSVSRSGVFGRPGIAVMRAMRTEPASDAPKSPNVWKI